MLTLGAVSSKHKGFVFQQAIIFITVNAGYLVKRFFIIFILAIMFLLQDYSKCVIIYV